MTQYKPKGWRIKPPRKYWHEGGLYLIRDVYFRGAYLGTCYAVPNPNGTKRWLMCREGVNFREIKPYRVRRYHGTSTLHR